MARKLKRFKRYEGRRPGIPKGIHSSVEVMPTHEAQGKRQTDRQTEREGVG